MSIPRSITHDMLASFRCHAGSEPQATAHHLDGYNQTDLLTGKGPSKRHELFYFGDPNRGAVRIDDMKIIFFERPWGWPAGEKTATDLPTLVNLRWDPFERTQQMRGEAANTGARVARARSWPLISHSGESNLTME